MKRLIIALVLFLSCSDKNNSVHAQPVEKPELILKGFMSYWNYDNKYVKLNREFIAQDESGNSIAKNIFFEKIIKQKYLSLRVISQENEYILYKLPQSTDSEILRIAAQQASFDYLNFKEENKCIGNFNFTSITGVNYNNENTKDKILVIKCWYIGCVKCVEEFPEMNKLVKKYYGKSNILFLSLALNNKEQLEKFLSKHPLKFNVIPDKESYLTDSLRINMYPTSLVVRNGIILKRVNDVEDLKLALDKLYKD